MHVQLSQPAKSTCLKLFLTLGESTDCYKAISLFLSHNLASAFSTTAFLHWGGLMKLVAGEFEPRLSTTFTACTLQVLLAKAEELRSCLCITWFIGQHLITIRQIVPTITKLRGTTSFEWNAVLWKNLKLFCVYVLGVGWHRSFSVTLMTIF